MRRMQGLIFMLLAVSVVGAWGMSRQPTLNGLTDKPFLYEVTRHLYRWYMDESDVEKATRDHDFVFWVKARHPELDPNDRSLYGEIILPEIGIKVKVKKADYTIDELGLVVKNDQYKIVNVGRVHVPDQKPKDMIEIRVDYAEMRDYLFKNRNKLEIPSESLQKKLGAALRKALKADAKKHGEALPTGEEIVHLSSLSPVANELWVFWETGRLLIRFSADIDLSNEALWNHQDLMIDTYDIDEQVVVSLDEVAGSNAYMTRDQVGRILFNCIVLGKRLVVRPEEAIR